MNPIALSVLVPVLMVLDVEKSLRFYEETLEFKRVGTVPDRPPFAFAEVERDGVKVMMQERKAFVEDLPALKDRPIGASLTLYVQMNGVRDLHEKVKGKVKIVKPLKDTFYGTREFYIQDPNGYIIGFSERVRTQD